MIKGPNLPLTAEEKFNHLLIDANHVKQLIGKLSPGEVSAAESEQYNSRRKLLDVEKNAIKNKEVMERSDAEFISSLSENLFQRINLSFKQEYQDSEEFLERTLGLSESVTHMLDALSTKACSVKMLEPIAMQLPWLYDELTKLLNSPKHRRKDSKGKVIVVDSLRTALSFMGVDNLMLLFPALLLKRSLPQFTDPFPQIKHKAWQYGLSCGLAARELAKYNNVNPYVAYCLAMLSIVGQNAISRIYFKCFEQNHLALLEDAQKKKHRDVHDGLLKVQPNSENLISMQLEHADVFAVQMFEFMNLTRLPLKNSLQSFINSTSLAEEQGLPKVLYQARQYAKYRMLRESKAIDMEQAKALLAQCKFPTGSLESLQKLVLKRLPLQITTT